MSNSARGGAGIQALDRARSLLATKPNQAFACLEQYLARELDQHVPCMILAEVPVIRNPKGEWLTVGDLFRGSWMTDPGHMGLFYRPKEETGEVCEIMTSGFGGERERKTLKRVRIVGLSRGQKWRRMCDTKVDGWIVATVGLKLDDSDSPYLGQHLEVKQVKPQELLQVVSAEELLSFLVRTAEDIVSRRHVLLERAVELRVNLETLTRAL